MKALKNKKQREEEQPLKEFYKIYRNVAHTMMSFATCIVIAEMERRGRSKAYIKKLFEDICLIADAPETNRRKRPSMLDIMHQQEEKYDIDYHDLVIHIETEREFIKGCKEG